MQSLDIRLLIFQVSTERRSLPFCYVCAKMGLAYLLIGKVVIKPYSCDRASSTAMSFSKLIVVVRFSSKAGLSSIGVNFPFSHF